MTAHLHPDTGLPYFGYPGDWAKALPDEVHVPSQRATTSSRKPGHVNEGTIFAAALRLTVCSACGKLAGTFPGAHAPRHDNVDPMLVVDCSGRRCVKDAKGYYQLAEASP